MIVAIDPLGRLIYFGDAVVVDDVIVAVAGGGVALGSCACVNTCLFPYWVVPILFFQVFTFLFACVNMFPQRLLGRNWL